MAEKLESLNEIKAATTEVKAARKPSRDKQGRSYATGKRKDAVARVWVKPGKGNVAGILTQGFPPDGVVQVFGFGGSAAVVPQNGRAQHPARGVQRHQTMHLPADADALHLGRVKPFQQGGHALPASLPPQFRGLFAPAGMWERQGIFFGNSLLYCAVFLH